MKKRIFALLCILMLVLAGCSPKPVGEPDTPDAPEVEEPKTIGVTVFVPDDQAEYLTAATVDIPEIGNEEMPDTLIRGLADAGVIPEDVAVQNFADADGALALDLSAPYLTALQASGSAGESMLLYAVVNTFFTHYEDAESLTLTVDGNVIETGHNLYDAPFTEMLYVAEN